MKQDKYAIRCSKCNTVYGRLGHLELFGKRRYKYKNTILIYTHHANEKELNNDFNTKTN